MEIKIGDKVWVNSRGPAYLWPRSDLVVFGFEEGGVEVGKEKDRDKSVKYTYRLRLEQIDKQ